MCIYAPHSNPTTAASILLKDKLGNQFRNFPAYAYVVVLNLKYQGKGCFVSEETFLINVIFYNVGYLSSFLDFVYSSSRLHIVFFTRAMQIFNQSCVYIHKTFIGNMVLK